MSLSSLGPLIAKGRTAEIFAWQENQILKLFYAWCPTHWAQEEIEMGRAITATTLPTPKLIGAAEVGGRQGIISERVDGPSMLKVANLRPWLALRLARQLAELHAQIHQQSGAGLPSLRSSLDATIKQVEALPSDLKSRVLRLLEELPDEPVLCHFDFHPDQVLFTASGPMIIDWMTARQGHPLADVARTSIILTVGQVPYAGRTLRALIDLWRGVFLRTYTARYLELRPGAKQKQIRAWMIPVAAGRLKEAIEGEQAPLLHMIQMYLSML